MSVNLGTATQNSHDRNYRFVTIDTVAAMLARRHKGLNFEKDDIIEYCRECIEEIADPDTCLLKKSDVELTVQNSVAELPCDVYRLLSVRVNGVTPSRSIVDDGTYLHMNFQSGKIRIDYFYLPETRDRMPIVALPARMACYYYCLLAIKGDDYERGLITQNVWNNWQTQYNYQVSRARGSFKNISRDDLNEIMRIMFTWALKPQIPRSID